jgi:hypothetical protein
MRNRENCETGTYVQLVFIVSFVPAVPVVTPGAIMPPALTLVVPVAPTAPKRPVPPSTPELLIKPEVVPAREPLTSKVPVLMAVAPV